NILTTGTDELAVIAPLYAAIGLLHVLLRKRLLQAGSFAWDVVFYATFGIVVTSSVARAGARLVSPLLIIPASLGLLYADTLGRGPDHRRLRHAAEAGAARRPAPPRCRRIFCALAARALFHRRRGRGVCRCRPLRRALPAGGGKTERVRNAQPLARRGARRLH